MAEKCGFLLFNHSPQKGVSRDWASIKVAYSVLLFVSHLTLLRGPEKLIDGVNEFCSGP